jgi:hypothetical protein
MTPPPPVQVNITKKSSCGGCASAFVALAVVGAIVGGCNTLFHTSQSSPAGSTVTTPASVVSPSPTHSAVAVRMPKLVGKNGAIAEDELTRLGITNVQWASADPTASVVLLAANWKVTQTDPKAGVKVQPGQLVVLTGVKIAQ